MNQRIAGDKTNDDKGYTKGLLLALLAAVSVSTSSVFIKVGLAEGVGPVTQLSLRMLMSAAIFWVVYLVFWPNLLRIDRRGLMWCAAVGAANSTSILCMYIALVRIDASIAFMIYALHPLAVLVLLAFRGEPITRMNMIRLGLGVVGVYLLVGPGGTVDPLGIALVMVTVVAYSLHLTLTQWHLSNYHPQTVVVYVITFMGLIMTAIRLLQFSPLEPISINGWWAIIGTVLLGTVLSRAALFAGIQHVGSGQVALIGPIETLLSVLWALLFLGERMSPLQWVGSLFILTGVLLVMHRRVRVAV